MTAHRPLVVAPFVLALALGGCGGPSTEPVTPGPAASGEPRADAPRIDPETGAVIPGSARVASPKLLDRRERTAIAPDNLGSVRSSQLPPKSSAELYRQVAPATVIIRVPNGMGSGVVIDPSGWVVTNHHVIETGTQEDFLTTVTVVLGSLDKKTGGMNREDKTYDAKVYKSDKLRDLALIKIENPPKGLPSIRLAKDNPVPGQDVHAIGHAGAGMLWAIKTGEISALGKLSEQLATLAQFKDDAEGKKAEASFKKYLDERNLGLVIQSTCNILPGDSGGPLITSQGELIGVNAFSNRDGKTGGLLSFHIHREEVANFVKERPKKPARLIPEPWKDGGGDASYEDVDLDGKVDVLMLQGRRPCTFCPSQSTAVFMDLDQNSYPPGPLPALAEVYEKKRFDAEVIYLQLERDAFIWYDTDNDGRMDVLLLDRGNAGRPSAAYRIAADGDLTRDDSLKSGRVLRPALFTSEAMRSRMARVAAGAFPAHFLESGGSAAETLPEPIGQTGTVTTMDLDFDGVRDAVRINTAFSSRVVVDVDRNSAPNVPASTTADKLGSFDGEVSVVSQGNQMWIWYDTDDDGRFDLVLHSPASRLYAARYAYRVDPSGRRTAAPEHVGRKLMRPELLSSSTHASALRVMAQKSFLELMSATTTDPLASFPHPHKDHRGTGYELLDTPGLQKSVIVLNAQGSDGYLVDVDGNSLRNKNTKTLNLGKLVTDDQFDAEFAYFNRNGMAWAYYDTDNDGAYDVVLYSGDPRSGKSTQGFRIDKAGQVSLDPALANRPLASHTLLKKKADQARLKKLVEKLFSGAALES
ncbi:MAG: trypsin-like peptidase domain-containing protein [Polyangiaceae bacterium]|nr:trypsin-like peptidase domain-containing protein [Polyangiaceae bacterium]